MKNLFKRSLAVALALVMCVSMLNLTAFAATQVGVCNHSGTEGYRRWPRYATECGGSYCVDSSNGWAVHVQKGTACTDIKNGGDGTSDSHDHQCDYCHAWMPESISFTITKQPTCSESGTKEYKCTYSGCNKNGSTETIPPLGHD